jgi:hypothetical protein
MMDEQHSFVGSASSASNLAFDRLDCGVYSWWFLDRPYASWAVQMTFITASSDVVHGRRMCTKAAAYAMLGCLKTAVQREIDV